MKKNIMKRYTMKMVIKKMLMDELDSKEQLEKLPTKARIDYDLCTTDDEKIRLYDSINRSMKMSGGHGILTAKAYLLMTAYKHSPSRLKEYNKMFHDTANKRLERAMNEARFFLKLADEGRKLYCDIKNVTEMLNQDDEK